MRAAVNVAAELGPAAGGVGKGARAARILAAVIILVRADGNRQSVGREGDAVPEILVDILAVEIAAKLRPRARRVRKHPHVAQVIGVALRADGDDGPIRVEGDRLAGAIGVSGTISGPRLLRPAAALPLVNVDYALIVHAILARWRARREGIAVGRDSNREAAIVTVSGAVQDDCRATCGARRIGAAVPRKGVCRSPVAATSIGEPRAHDEDAAVGRERDGIAKFIACDRAIDIGAALHVPACAAVPRVDAHRARVGSRAAHVVLIRTNGEYAAVRGERHGEAKAFASGRLLAVQILPLRIAAAVPSVTRM